jgi:hypothetical protein
MGQDVPDDIAPGKRSELAALIAGGQPIVMNRSMS